MIQEPWPHIIIDDFLPIDEFANMKQICSEAFANETDIHNHSTVDYGSDSAILRHQLNYDPLLKYNMKQYLQYFDHREYNELKTFVNYVKTSPNFVHPKHVEAPFKIMSSILYLGPDSNKGTRLYKEEEGNVITEIKWKPNTMFIFCGEDNVTWHDYTSSTDRYTFNHFLVDPVLIENEEYKNQCVN